jgi:hypothetical protein
MLIPYVKGSIALLLIFSTVLLLTGAKQSALVKPAWLDGIDDIPCDAIGGIISGEISSEETLGFSIDLEEGTYSVAGWGSWDLIALRLAVRTESGEELGQDNGNDNSPIVTFDLSEASAVTIVLTAGQARIDGATGSYSFAIMEGADCFDRELFPAKEALDIWTSIVYEENATLLRWEMIQIEGEDSIYFTHQLPAGSYMVVAETTNPFDDIDMYVRFSSDNVISQDELPNNYPVCRFELDRERTVNIEVELWEYGAASGTGIVFLLARDNQAE